MIGSLCSLTSEGKAVFAFCPSSCIIFPPRDKLELEERGWIGVVANSSSSSSRERLCDGLVKMGRSSVLESLRQVVFAARDICRCAGGCCSQDD